MPRQLCGYTRRDKDEDDGGGEDAASTVRARIRATITVRNVEV